jgi:phosphatidylglycerol:prolipoprotein diacylglycerol transferase
MYPVLFEFFGLKIYSYGVMVALAFLLGFALIFHRARQAGDRVDDYMEAAIWFIIAGIGGARLFYFIWYPDVFLQDPIGTMLSQGGLVWYGGVIGVTVAVLLFTRIKKIRLFHFADIVAPAAALGLAIGRIGCLLSGCCFGSVCNVPWAIQYPHIHETHGLPVHPAPLYETFLMLAAMGALLKLDQKKPFEGYTTGWFFIMAGLVRFVLEYYRGDRLVWIEPLNLSASQVVSVAGILIGVLALYILGLRNRVHQAVSNAIAASAQTS